MKNKSKKKVIGKSLNKKYKIKLAKKKMRQGENVFICESHAHENNSCGNIFASNNGNVSCPKCGNVYCRWVNYKDTSKILSTENDEQ